MFQNGLGLTIKTAKNNKNILHLRFAGIMFGGAYARSLDSNFYATPNYYYFDVYLY